MLGRTKRHRRNGKLEACEFCRRHKVACDHALPRCSRCAKKNLRCVYHPAPLTRAIILTDPGAAKETATAASSSSSAALASPPKNDTDAVVGEVSDGPDTLTRDELLPGFLGGTSVVELFIDQSNTETQTLHDPWSETLNKVCRPCKIATQNRLVAAERIRSGSRFLSLLGHLPSLREAIMYYCDISPTRIMPRIVFVKIFDSLEHLAPLVATEKGCEELATRIVRNNCTPVVVDANVTPKNLHDQYTGTKLRWETVAFAFTMAAMSFLHGSEKRRRSTESDEASIMQKFVFASEACMGFLDGVESLNDMTLWVQHASLIMLTITYGDISHKAWQRLNSLVTIIFAMGVHLDPPDETKLPFFLAHTRRMAFSFAFSTDKGLTNFFGRPPRIAKHYCSRKVVLDLSEDYVVAPEAERLAAIAALDPNGWNTTKSLYRATWARLKLLTSMAREEALELCLGVDVQDIEQKAWNTLSRTETMWEAIPLGFKYHDAVWESDINPNTCFSLLYYYLHYLHTQYLVHRTLVRHCGTTPHTLFQVAQTILTNVLHIAKNRDRVLALAVDFSWVSLFYGLPAAALLAMELLKQKENPSPTQATLPRALLLRNISVFVSTLEWVAKPTDGNYDLCQGSKLMLENLLDTILDSDAPQSTNSAATGQTPAQSAPQDPVIWVDDFLGEGWMANGVFAESIGVESTFTGPMTVNDWVQPGWQMPFDQL